MQCIGMCIHTVQLLTKISTHVSSCAVHVYTKIALVTCFADHVLIHVLLHVLVLKNHQHTLEHMFERVRCNARDKNDLEEDWGLV